MIKARWTKDVSQLGDDTSSDWVQCLPWRLDGYHQWRLSSRPRSHCDGKKALDSWCVYVILRWMMSLVLCWLKGISAHKRSVCVLFWLRTVSLICTNHLCLSDLTSCFSLLIWEMSQYMLDTFLVVYFKS